MSARGEVRLRLIEQIVDAVAPLCDRYRPRFDELGYELDVEACVAPRLNGHTIVGILLEIQPKVRGEGPHGHHVITVWRRTWFRRNWLAVQSLDMGTKEARQVLSRWLEEIDTASRHT
jgi:hypothetical protein